MRIAILAAVAALCLAMPARAQYDVSGTLTASTCTGTAGTVTYAGVAGSQEAGCLAINIEPSMGSVSVQVSTNGSTLQFEVTNDLVNYVSASGYPLPSGPGVTSTTTTGIWHVDVAGTKRLRVRASVFGTNAVLSMRASLDPAVGIGGTQIVVGAVTNDATAIGPGAETQPGVARAAPTALTAGRSEKLELDATTGAQFVGEAATTTATGLTPVVISVNTTINAKAGAGNLYGVACVNANATACYLQFYNTASTPTCGTSVVHSIPLAFTAAGNATVVQPGPLALANFATGIGVCMGTTQTGATACTTANSCTLWVK